MSNFEHENVDVDIPHVELQESNSAFGRRIREFELVNFGYKKIDEFLIGAFDLYEAQIVAAVTQFNIIKTVSYFSAEFERSFVKDEVSDPIFETRMVHIPTKVKEIDSSMNLNDYFQSEIWSILAALHHDQVHAKNKNRVNNAASYQRWANELNFDGIEFPVQLNQIEKFMQQNDGIAINVYYFDSEKKRICPLLLAMKPVNYRYVHLLLLTEETQMYCKEPSEVNTHSHYCWIKNLNGLVRAQLTKHEHKISICDRCLNHFYSDKELEKHRKICMIMNESAIEMPHIGNKYETFKNYKNEIKIPFIVYADTEALLKQPETPVFNTDCSTQAHQHHEAHSIGYYFKCENDESRSWYANHRGADCLDWFMIELTKIAEEVYDFLEDKKPMIALTKEEESLFSQSIACHICKKSFNDNADEQIGIRVRDHCHITGNYRGAAHQSCNLQYQISRTIPVVMHNLSGYDSHLLIKKLATTKNFPDHLATLLPQENKHILKSECIKSGYHSVDLFTLLNRKGVFPYEYIDNYEKLEETMLPSIESFFSTLTQSNISEEDYKHAQNVWEKFGIRTLAEFSDLYLKTDVLLLADVFENFRNTCHATYSLDPAHYFSAPGLSFDAMLKYTGVSIELFTDIDMLMFAERGIRGGVSQINKRYAKANNTYMGEEFDPSKESSYIMYLDANNLYGYAMSQCLPIGEYQWLSEHVIEQNFNTLDYQKNESSILNLKDESDMGYIFEVDLHYPSNLHEKHNDFPFCPEKRTIPGITKIDKLLLTFYDKEKYIVHYSMLKLALEHGLILKKVHRVLQFRQSAWLKPYIELNTKLRAQANNDFEKDFYKLLNNAIYGKTMENLRLRSDIRLINKWYGRVGGMCILEISKVLMYKFLYNYLKPKYGQNIQVVYTDTDSFILEIKTSDVYAHIRDEPIEFDTSDYLEGNIYGIERHNKKVPGKFKDELNGEILTEVVGLRSKCYAVRTLGGIDKMKKAKGVKKNKKKSYFSEHFF
ncbi:uncharacterized protein LOC116346631 [Contarinia nasturtii]|uniref:uncharacterized protein LOC116346631 n=1 Tax=Contarinia nasturtii TaxID=265458 RepID=UPI0012D4992B|nr:uncharacterized protein LOC116346631 [Contarinia nasturtii]